jgi:CubicO group peptidase (beta-lactamase class C family)
MTDPLFGSWGQETSEPICSLADTNVKEVRHDGVRHEDNPRDSRRALRYRFARRLHLDQQHSSATIARHERRPTTNATGLSANPTQEAAVDKTVQNAIKQRHLRAVIVRVTVDGQEIITRNYGESMTGVPATTDMHFRNGAIAIPYVSTLLLMLVDEKKVSLDDKASKWVPEIPHSDEVTLGQLAQMTSGYTDYVIGNEEVDAMLYTDPFRQWTPEELLKTVTSKPLLYPPGTNWNYAHTNYLILGLALEKATGERMSDLLQEKVLARSD